jgi:hypothetical protein
MNQKIHRFIANRDGTFRAYVGYPTNPGRRPRRLVAASTHEDQWPLAGFSLVLTVSSQIKNAFIDQSRTRQDSVLVINPQCRDRAACDRRQANQHRSVPFEVILPIVCPGIEKANYFTAFRINAGNVRPLEIVAIKARVSQVGDFCLATVFLGDYVIKLKRCVRKYFGKSAILASTFGSSPNNRFRCSIGPAHGLRGARSF